MINVDYFWDIDPENMTDQRIELAETITKDCDMMMVFKGRRSLMTEVVKQPGYFEFTNVPKGVEVQVVALKLTKKEGVKLKIEEVTIGAPEDVVITLDQMNSLAEMDEVLSGLK